MADRPQDLIQQSQAGLEASGVPLAPKLNPAPQYSDPAMGPFDPTAPVAPPAGPPDPAQIKASSPHAVQAPALPQPPAPPGLAGTQYETTTTRSEATSGLSDAGFKRANERLDAAGDAQRKASADEVAAKQARADYEVRATEAALSDVAQRRREAAAEQALNDHTMAEVDRRMQAASDWRPERKNMFGFGAGRGLAAAVAVIAGGWMQGRGQTSTNQFLPFVMKMIDEDVNDQVRSNSANIQFLREQKGDLKAAALELKKRQLMLVDAELQAKAAAGAAKDPSVAAAIEAYKSKSAAEQAAWDAEQRKALERTVTKQVSRVTSPVHMQPGQVKERSEAEGKSAGVQAALNAYGEKAGLMRDANGKWVVGKGALPPAVIEKLNPFDDDEIQAHAEAAVEAYGRMQSGGVIGAEERPAFRDQLGLNTTTRAQLAQRLNAAEVALQPRLRSTDAAKQEQETRIPYQRIR